MFFFSMKELKGAILCQNHRRSHEGGAGSQGPLNRNATNDTNLTKKPCFFIFSFFLASLPTTEQAYNSN